MPIELSDCRIKNVFSSLDALLDAHEGLKNNKKLLPVYQMSGEYIGSIDNPEDALKEANLNWRPLSFPVYFKVEDQFVETSRRIVIKYPGFDVLSFSNDFTTLGNDEFLDLMKRIGERYNTKPEWAGYIRGAKTNFTHISWFLMPLKKYMKIDNAIIKFHLLGFNKFHSMFLPELVVLMELEESKSTFCYGRSGIRENMISHFVKYDNKKSVVTFNDNTFNAFNRELQDTILFYQKAYSTLLKKYDYDFISNIIRYFVITGAEESMSLSILDSQKKYLDYVRDFKMFEKYGESYFAVFWAYNHMVDHYLISKNHVYSSWFYNYSKKKTNMFQKMLLKAKRA